MRSLAPDLNDVETTPVRHKLAPWRVSDGLSNVYMYACININPLHPGGLDVLLAAAMFTMSAALCKLDCSFSHRL